MRDQYAFDAAGDPFGSLVTVELPPPEWNTKLNFTKHWGAQESASIIRHFCAARHSVPDCVRKVIGMGISTSSLEENKGHYPNLKDFQKICEDSMFIHNGEMMAIILHAFVPSIEASEHIQTLGDFF
ncbi:unnamed protein product [Sphagnum troendelagicum]|uniref:Uncharacterized protein n=1 Tax=Sphagnum troendelagicum TaxID=128251 RepID=A0ABP0TCU5_9BRYO